MVDIFIFACIFFYSLAWAPLFFKAVGSQPLRMEYFALVSGYTKSLGGCVILVL